MTGISSDEVEEDGKISWETSDVELEEVPTSSAKWLSFSTFGIEFERSGSVSSVILIWSGTSDGENCKEAEGDSAGISFLAVMYLVGFRHLSFCKCLIEYN